MKRIFLILVVLSFSGCAGFERRHSLTFDFERISTFTFDYRFCGVVGSPPDEKIEMIGFIREAIEKELTHQGFIPVRTHPEMRIRFGLILTSNGKDLNPRNIKQHKDEESPEYAPTFDYKPGSLIIDAVDPFYHESLWRSAIDTKIRADMPLDKKKKIIAGSVSKLLKDFLNLQSRAF